MVPSIARQSVILKCNMQKSVMLGNYEFFYAAGLMRKLYNIEIIKNYEPSADHDAQMDELFAWGEQEPDMWQVTTSFHPVIR